MFSAIRPTSPVNQLEKSVVPRSCQNEQPPLVAERYRGPLPLLVTATAWAQEGRFPPSYPPPQTATALQALLVAVPILIDVAALRHPTLLVQSKREPQLRKRQGGGKEKKKAERKKEKSRRKKKHI